ncbi:hypothetical protein HI914_01701 [Erysiphe necator]|nr:hypothetical protein HI914_01701 [Erysiphe necator]
MSEETEMISSDDSDTKELSSSKPKKSSGNGSGQEGSENFTPNSDVDQNEKIKVAIDAPDKTLDQVDESDNQLELQDSENYEHLSSVPKNSKTESLIDVLDQDLSVKKADLKSTNINSCSDIKSKARRRSSGVPEHRTKKINKKASKAKLTHIDAKPGDYFYVRLKGYPLWPAIVCDEEMLPKSLLKTRPVTAARADGSYREDFMDGAPKAKDRSFPVLYLYTNEFGWIPNYDLLEIDFDEITNTTGSMRKDLATARQLAAEKHDLDYFKQILKSFMEETENERLENEKAEEEKLMPKDKKDSTDRKKTARKPKKSKVVIPKDEDSSMLDINTKPDSEDPDSNYLAVCVKRSANEPLEGPPKKRTTIKLTTKAKPEAEAPKHSKVSDSKKNKLEKPEKVAKVKKIKVSLAPSITASTPNLTLEPELSIEEKRLKREKEILFLRHKLQKGLLAKDQEVKIEDMKSMSEFIEKLEAYNDLEATVIRQTKINKVLKAILKIPKIPLENEYKFKPRSQNLLDQWNKLQIVDSGISASSHTNGVNLEVKAKPEEDDCLKTEPKDVIENENEAKKVTESSINAKIQVVDDAIDLIPDESKKVSTKHKNSET